MRINITGYFFAALCLRFLQQVKGKQQTFSVENLRCTSVKHNHTNKNIQNTYFEPLAPFYKEWVGVTIL